MKTRNENHALTLDRILRKIATLGALVAGVAALNAQNSTNGQNPNSPNNSSMESEPKGTETDTANGTGVNNSSTSTSTSDATTGGVSTLSHGDKRFIMKAAEASTNEVALSVLADGRASNSDVKSFAQMMVTDHGKANTDLQALASSKGIDIAKAVEKGNTADVNSLSAKSGVDFDNAYAKKMQSAHEDAVKLFKKEADEGKDADVVAFAKKYVDTMSMHLDHAKSLKQAIEK